MAHTPLETQGFHPKRQKQALIAPQEQLVSTQMDIIAGQAVLMVLCGGAIRTCGVMPYLT